MEQPKPEPETEHATQAPVQDPNQKPDPKEESHAPNGDGKWTSFVMESESQNETQNEPSPNRIASSGSRKSVHWSPELVTESSAMSSPHESNPYVSTARAPSSSFSLKGIVFSPQRVFISVYILKPLFSMYNKYVPREFTVLFFGQIRCLLCGMCWGGGERRLGKPVRRLKISLGIPGNTVSF